MNPFRSPKRIAVVAGTLLVMAGSIWAVWHFWPNRHLARAQELRGQLAGDAGRSLSAEERRELWSQLRAEAKKLSPEERRNLWREQQQKRMKEYFALSGQEKVAFLDAQINRMEQWRREQAQAGGDGAPAWGQQKRFLSPEDRDKRRRERLDLTTPEERAMRHEFFKDLQARRQQRGLGSFGFPGWGR
jgi:hypothetical protein